MAASVIAGPLPMDTTEYDRFKRSTKKQRTTSWNMQNGWRKQPKQPKMRHLESSSGNVYEMPEDDYEEYMTFYRAATDPELSEQYKASGRARDVQTPADYVDRAFGKNTKAKVYEHAGQGHILYIWYSPMYQILKVKFWNETVVAFLRVPAELGQLMLTLCESPVTRPDSRGVQRHILGIQFWDLIRIRGTVHGSRYKFVYVEDHNTGGLPGRPFGSGEKLWETEDVHASEALGENAEFVNAAAHYFEKIANAYEQSGFSKEAANARKLAESYKEASSDMGKLLDKDDVVWKHRVGYDIAPDNFDRHASDILTLGKKSVDDSLNGVKEQLESDRQRKEISKIIPESVAQRIIAAHNKERESQRTWDNERVTELAEQLARENRFNIEQFNSKFPNAAEQFDYFKARGLIPPNARFRP